jgi:hypothetical protein
MKFRMRLAILRRAFEGNNEVVAHYRKANGAIKERQRIQ